MEEVEKLAAFVLPYVYALGDAFDLSGGEAIQLAGVAVISWLGAHAITQGDMRR